MGPHRAPVSERDRRRTPVRLHRGGHVRDPGTAKGRLGEGLPRRRRKGAFFASSFLRRSLTSLRFTETGPLNLFRCLFPPAGHPIGPKVQLHVRAPSSSVVLSRFINSLTSSLLDFDTRAAVCISSTSRRLCRCRIRAMLPFRPCSPAIASRSGTSRRESTDRESVPTQMRSHARDARP